MRTMSEFRTEKDSMGDVQVPAEAYYSAQTQRAVENFPISGWSLPASLIPRDRVGQIRLWGGESRLEKLTGTGKNPLDQEQVDAMLQACQEVAGGQMLDQFPMDVFQTGSGTSSNMNVNEVISNRAIEILGGDRFQATKPIHPNDHVNMGQSTNDTFPTAIHVAAAGSRSQQDLLPALERLANSLASKAKASRTSLLRSMSPATARFPPATLRRTRGSAGQVADHAVEHGGHADRVDQPAARRCTASCSRRGG